MGFKVLWSLAGQNVTNRTYLAYDSSAFIAEELGFLLFRSISAIQSLTCSPSNANVSCRSFHAPLFSLMLCEFNYKFCTNR